MSTTANTQPTSAALGRSRIGDLLDLANAAARREELLAHAAMRGLELDLSTITSCDLAGLQLLAAARATAAANEAPFRLHNPSPAVLAACAAFGVDLEDTTQKP